MRIARRSGRLSPSQQSLNPSTSSSSTSSTSRTASLSSPPPPPSSSVLAVAWSGSNWHIPDASGLVLASTFPSLRTQTHHPRFNPPVTVGDPPPPLNAPLDAPLDPRSFCGSLNYACPVFPSKATRIFGHQTHSSTSPGAKATDGAVTAKVVNAGASATASASASTPSDTSGMSGTGTDGTTASASSVAQSSGSTGVSSSLYLFTFLITILVLGLISAALLLRAYYVRRQFQRRVEAAIRAGQPLPEDAAQALGLVRPRRKNEKKVGPMPGLWESEMYIDRKADEVGDEEKGWAHLTPVSIVHYPPPREPTPPPELPLVLPPRRNLMRETIALFRSEPARPQLQRLETSTSMRPLAPALTVPNPGEEVTVGVLISLPFEERVGRIGGSGKRARRGLCRRFVWGLWGAG